MAFRQGGPCTCGEGGQCAAAPAPPGKGPGCKAWEEAPPDEERVDSGFLDSFRSDCSLDGEKRSGEASATPLRDPGANPWTFLTDEGDTYLSLCIIHEQQRVALDLILQSPPEFLNFHNTLLQTPLHLAVYLHQVTVVRALVLKGADTAQQDRHGNTPFHLACQHGFLDCLQALTLAPTLPETSVFPSASSVPPTLLALSLWNWKGLTCLHQAVLHQHWGILQYLLALGADINAQDRTCGRTALHLAVEMGDANLVAVLLDHGAEVDPIMYNGCTPLHLAAGRLNISIWNMLCQAGADRLLPNMEGETPQDLADSSRLSLAICQFDDLTLWGRPYMPGKLI
ncbi:NF-kappa-B inhibitor epsilon-like [Lissotriton helveticus]